MAAAYTPLTEVATVLAGGHARRPACLDDTAAQIALLGTLAGIAAHWAAIGNTRSLAATLSAIKKVAGSTQRDLTKVAN